MPTRILNRKGGANQQVLFLGKNIGFQDAVTREEGFLNDDGDSSSSSSSSIGKNSDLSENSSQKSGEVVDEAHSPFKEPSESMEEVLPTRRRGISCFYDGKSKSFTTLSDASSLPSIKDLAKPENAYERRRERTRASCFSTIRSNGTGVSKRVVMKRQVQSMANLLRH